MTWPIAALGSVAKIERIAIDPARIEGRVHYVGLENITREGRLVDVSMTTKGELKSSKFRFDQRHVLYGKLRPNLSKVCSPAIAGICSTDILPIRPSDKLDRGYLTYYLRSPDIVSQATRLAVGINLPRLSPSALAAFEIPIPPIEEQRRIAAVLEAADVLRMKRRHTVSKLDALAQAIFVEMFGDPGEQSDALGIALCEVATIVTGNTPSRAEPANFGQDIDWIKSDNIKASGCVSVAAEALSATGLRKARTAPQLSTLMVCIAGSPSSIGRVGLLDRTVAFNQQINAVIPGPRVLPVFLFHQLRLSQTRVQALSTNSMKGMVSKSSLSQLMMIVPEIRLQAEFVERATAAAKVRAAAQASADCLDGLFESLQQRAFRGEL